jgi:hypothetical protein
VLGADVVVVENLRLFLGEDDHPTGSVGETLEHLKSSPPTLTREVAPIHRE